MIEFKVSERRTPQLLSRSHRVLLKSIGSFEAIRWRWLIVSRRTYSLLLRACAALYFVTFDTGGDAMDDGAWDEAAAGAFFMNFFSGMS